MTEEPVRDRMVEAITERVLPTEWADDLRWVLVTTATWDDWLVLYQLPGDYCERGHFRWFGDRKAVTRFILGELVPARASRQVADMRFLTWAPAERIAGEETAGVDWDTLLA